MIHNKNKSFLGQGWSFPPTFLTEKRIIKLVSEEEDIKESLFVMLSTLPGERVMRPNYGCDLHSITFERMNDETEQRIIDLVSRAILMNEPRINLEAVNVEFFEEFALIAIEYTIRKINVRRNIVYPFYLVEGTDIGEV